MCWNSNNFKIDLTFWIGGGGMKGDHLVFYGRDLGWCWYWWFRRKFWVWPTCSSLVVKEDPLWEAAPNHHSFGFQVFPYGSVTESALFCCWSLSKIIFYILVIIYRLGCLLLVPYCWMFAFLSLNKATQWSAHKLMH